MINSPNDQIDFCEFTRCGPDNLSLIYNSRRKILH